MLNLVNVRENLGSKYLLSYLPTLFCNQKTVKETKICVYVGGINTMAAERAGTQRKGEKRKEAGSVWDRS